MKASGVGSVAARSRTDDQRGLRQRAWCRYSSDISNRVEWLARTAIQIRASVKSDALMRL